MSLAYGSMEKKFPKKISAFAFMIRSLGSASFMIWYRNFGRLEPATIKVFYMGGFEEGEHDIDVRLMFHSPYMPISDAQYMPIDGCGSKRLVLRKNEGRMA